MKASRMWSSLDPIQSRSPYETPRQNPINVFTGVDKSLGVQMRERLLLDDRIQKDCFGSGLVGQTSLMPLRGPSTPASRPCSPSSAQPEKATAYWPLQEAQAPEPGPGAPLWPHGAHCHQNLGSTLRTSFGRHPWNASLCSSTPPAPTQAPMRRSTAGAERPSIQSERAAHKHMAQPGAGTLHSTHVHTRG